MRLIEILGNGWPIEDDALRQIMMLYDSKTATVNKVNSIFHELRQKLGEDAVKRVRRRLEILIKTPKPLKEDGRLDTMKRIAKFMNDHEGIKVDPEDVWLEPLVNEPPIHFRVDSKPPYLVIDDGQVRAVCKYDQVDRGYLGTFGPREGQELTGSHRLEDAFKWLAGDSTQSNPSEKDEVLSRLRINDLGSQSNFTTDQFNQLPGPTQQYIMNSDDWKKTTNGYQRGINESEDKPLLTRFEQKRGWWIEPRATIPCGLPKDGLICVFHREDAEPVLDQNYPHKGEGYKKKWYFEDKGREIAEIDAEGRISANPQVLWRHFMSN